MTQASSGVGRRNFLAALLGSAAIDPERLLWIPGKKVISVPKPSLPQALYRIPVCSSIGGAYRTFDIDGGDLGIGSFMSITYEILSDRDVMRKYGHIPADASRIPIGA